VCTRVMGHLKCQLYSCVQYKIAGKFHSELTFENAYRVGSGGGIRGNGVARGHVRS